MSDRTYAQVIVYDCPEAERAACLAAIFEGFESETLNEMPSIDTDPTHEGAPWAAGRFRAVDTLVLGDRYGDDQCAGDQSETIAAAIIEAAPGAVFVAWTDPAYEWLGSLVAYTPELGRFAAECDANGNPTVTTADVRRMMADSLTDGPYGDRWPDANLREALDAALGIPWDDAFKAARARLAPELDARAAADLAALDAIS